MIVEVGDWVLDQAVADLHRWRHLGLVTRVAVNVSPWQLHRRGFAEAVLARLNSTPQHHIALDLEITESALLQEPDETTRTLTQLRASGVGIAIDDFGTGYSSLSRLSLLPIDTLKIDRSFISGLPSNAVSHALASTIISLARTFHMVTVAEGVETTDQLRALEELGCQQSQGFLHGKPMSFDEMTLRLISARDDGRLMKPHSTSDQTIVAAH